MSHEIRDPVEAPIAAALQDAGIPFAHESQDKAGLDFELPEAGLSIECAQFYTPRKITQLEGRENVVLVQGVGAAAFLADLLKAKATLNRVMRAIDPDPEYPIIGPLSWLRSAVDELKSRGPDEDDDDSLAFHEMVREVEDFLKNLTTLHKELFPASGHSSEPTPPVAPPSDDPDVAFVPY